ncbi:MAG: anthranilate synthase component I family protein [Candidatus Gracilibacteria bacterium]|nr:anthranilate synthase component I family protein [Candidatus Gracilibacteria bacterium]MDD5179388.1 anthranilate synthase component I family protein [Candidatus Gracilibacteria bacterium]
MELQQRKLEWISPREVLGGFQNTRGVILLESVKGGEYSILTAQPQRIVKNFQSLQREIQKLPKLKSPLPFSGGLLGMLSYEFSQELESRGLPLRGKFPFHLTEKIPRVWFGIYSAGLIFHHPTQTLRAFGWNTAALQQAISWRNSAQPIQLYTAKAPRIVSNFTKARYLTAIRKIQNYIRDGFTYQVNLSQRFTAKVGKISPREIYAKLCETNPAPFAGFLDSGDFQIISSSPELLFRVKGNKIETWPIAGTKPRGKNSREDLKLEKELLNSLKEKAEHLMLVDLLRNDIGKVCVFNSVKVSDLMRVEKYARVQHFVSTVVGKLRSGVGFAEIIRAVFPGGTITGCPKIETMKIITQCEKSSRGIYTGSLGYISANGNMDFNILIRSFFLQNGKLTFQTGGGIVADSNPSREYEETLHKAAALFEAVLS